MDFPTLAEIIPDLKKQLEAPNNRRTEIAEATEITALDVTKLDGTAKGGVVIGISHELKVPVKYIGIGEKVTDLQLFDSTAFVSAIFDEKI